MSQRTGCFFCNEWKKKSSRCAVTAMPTTRAARRAARCLTEVLPADALGLVLYQLTLAHDIAAVAPTCHQLCDAVKLAMKLRPFSGEVVTLGGHVNSVNCVAVLPNGRIITGSLRGCQDLGRQQWRRTSEETARGHLCGDGAARRCALR